ncbi:beta subunit of citrate lyase [Coniochaeta sp. PMI_546]|nr:beta subunit of citrate lyase [Coniochaeta sp. PMI_546]
MASVATSVLRRALLYVPASSQKMLQKSLTLTSDNITYDLEDSVTNQQKPAARSALRDHLSKLAHRPDTISELAVRINAMSTSHAEEDLRALAALPNVDAIVIPKVNSANDLHAATEIIRHVSPSRSTPLKLIALIESARAVMDLREICSASPDLDGLVFAAEDFALDMSLTRTPSLSEFHYARSAVATAARAYELTSAIDLVCTSFRGEEGVRKLEEECRNGRGMGFNGKQCIHPSQVEVVQRIFGPDKDEVEWAVRVVIADEKAEKAGRGAWTLDGKMIDAPVSGKARAVVAKAERCGFDVEALRQKWKDQEPE